VVDNSGELRSIRSSASAYGCAAAGASGRRAVNDIRDDRVGNLSVGLSPESCTALAAVLVLMALAAGAAGRRAVKDIRDERVSNLSVGLSPETAQH
jgi:hypothetical protein